MDVLLYDSAHRNFYFSAEVSKAIGQSHRSSVDGQNRPVMDT
jgi:hypothetical protein